MWPIRGRAGIWTHICPLHNLPLASPWSPSPLAAGTRAWGVINHIQIKNHQHDRPSPSKFMSQLQSISLSNTALELHSSSAGEDICSHFPDEETVAQRGGLPVLCYKLKPGLLTHSPALMCLSEARHHLWVDISPQQGPFCPIRNIMWQAVFLPRKYILISSQPR